MAEIAVAPVAQKKKWPSAEEVTLEFPLRECEHCGWSLLDAPAKATEKGFNSNGKFIYTDFCPRCGRGYVVWTEPDSAPAPKSEAAIPTPAHDFPGQEESASPERPAPFKGAYYCPKCNKNHMEKSNLGKAHLKHKEG